MLPKESGRFTLVQARPGIGIPMNIYKTPDEEEIQRINLIQKDFFSKHMHVFDPPLPEGVPERLKLIVASAKIAAGNVVLDVGSGTGILLPLIKVYEPKTIYACDLSGAMLERLKEHYPYAKTIVADVRSLNLPAGSIDVVFINACYSNLMDKQGVFANISRMVKTGGRMVISHPMGKAFINILKKKSPFPLDDFPQESEAKTLLEPYGFGIIKFTDMPELYALVAEKQSIP